MLDLDDLEDEQLQLPSVKVEEKELDNGVVPVWMAEKGVTRACSASAVRVTSASTLAGAAKLPFQFSSPSASASSSRSTGGP